VPELSVVYKTHQVSITFVLHANKAKQSQLFLKCRYQGIIYFKHLCKTQHDLSQLCHLTTVKIPIRGVVRAVPRVLVLEI
jgi:hypothetical protein